LVGFANVELTAAGVPSFLAFDHIDMTARAGFQGSAWKFLIQNNTVQAATLTDKAAKEAADAVLHESRHAEQAFLAARYMAGTGESAANIVASVGIPMAIATAAVGNPLTAASGATEFALGQEMHQSMVVDDAAHHATSNRAGAAIDKLKLDRAAAQTALSNLASGPTQGTYDAGIAARDTLHAQIRAVEVAYDAYRAIPHEADAHEVGISTEVAYGLLP
jgi:hypothetical protein